MSYVKRIVCLTNSLKTGGSCIAGRELLPNGKYGGWVRPVSSRPTAEISFMESLCQGNTDPRLLDILDIPLKHPLPHHHQTENHEIDATRPWIRLGQIDLCDLPRLCQHPTALWANTDRTTHGAFDCISRQEASVFTKSIVMVYIPCVKVEVRTGVKSGESRTCYRAAFQYNKLYYCLSLTDPAAIHAFGRKGNGTYELTNAHLCISLTEPLATDNNRCHKLVASILASPLL